MDTVDATEDRLEFLGQVAAWYYEDDLDQTEIAQRIGKSRSMVSRLLREARDRGLVEFRVRFPLRTDSALEDELKSAAGLSEARVLVADDLPFDSMMRRLGRVGARAVQSRLRSDIKVTIGWGAALFHTVRAMPEIRLDGVMVIQAMGSVGDGDPGVDGADLARTLATKLNADFRTLAAPLLVDSEEVAASLKADRTNAATIAMAAEAEVFVTGIGTIDSELSGLVRAGYFTDSQIRNLRSLGVVGDLMGYLIDRDGNILDIPENGRVVALFPGQMRGTTIAVAGGAAKATAIRAVALGGYLDVLVTDTTAARAILGDTRLLGV
ncbi:MAG: sugar-binding transcriptional regulator [Acidimicrobiia bacterium]